MFWFMGMWPPEHIVVQIRDTAVELPGRMGVDAATVQKSGIRH
jgi:hypothetical protein